MGVKCFAFECSDWSGWVLVWLVSHFRLVKLVLVLIVKLTCVPSLYVPILAYDNRFNLLWWIWTLLVEASILSFIMCFVLVHHITSFIQTYIMMTLVIFGDINRVSYSSGWVIRHWPPLFIFIHLSYHYLVGIGRLGSFTVIEGLRLLVVWPFRCW